MPQRRTYGNTFSLKLFPPSEFQPPLMQLSIRPVMSAIVYASSPAYTGILKPLPTFGTQMSMPPCPCILA